MLLAAHGSIVFHLSGRSGATPIHQGTLVARRNCPASLGNTIGTRLIVHRNHDRRRPLGSGTQAGHCSMLPCNNGRSSQKTAAVYTARNAWRRSAIRSSGCSTPTERRIIAGPIPNSSRSSGSTSACVMVAGCSANDSVPPRLTAR